ncbi:MAG: hypothetical protein R3C59_08045 [Planctomycetaceae bacterium]
MAKELGMGPKSLIKNIRNKSQPWKMPVKVWIRDLYFEKFGDREPQVPDVHEPATPMPLTSKPRRVVKPEQPCADEGSNTFPVSLFGETSDEEIPF